MAGSGSGGNSGVFSAVEYQFSKMKREKDETVEQFAERLYQAQIDVISAHAGRDCWEPRCDRNSSFAALHPSIRAHWIEYAKKKG